MPEFQFHTAATAEEAVALYHAHENARYVAGGTDLLPNVKHRIVRPAHLVGLQNLPKPEPRVTDEAIHLSAQMTLTELAEHADIQRLLAPLAKAASLVAGPQIRNMGTLGGNVMLDTRCLFYNQTEFWRDALGYCLKAEGTWCHVIGSPKTCVAVQSSDTVPVLMALDAKLVFLSPNGSRELAIRELFQMNGMDHLKLAEGELLTEIVVPRPRPGFRGDYEKLRVRDAIDFPLISVAITGIWNEDTPLELCIVVGAGGPRPKPTRGLDAFLNQPMTEQHARAVSALVTKQTRPQSALSMDPAWRRHMAGVFTRKMLTRFWL